LSIRPPRANKALWLFLGTLVLIYLIADYQGEFDKAPFTAQKATINQQQAANDNDPILSDQRIQHILYGDGSGGGHKHGQNKPCKSEFPEGWDDEKILTTVQKIAANDNLPWQQEDNGYYVSEYVEEDVKIRVVLGGQKKRIITAYPVNVPRNPCPANTP
jgi:hypothetical protein